MGAELRHAVYKWIIFITIVITIYAAQSANTKTWKMWVMVPIIFFCSYLAGKWTNHTKQF